MQQRMKRGRRSASVCRVLFVYFTFNYFPLSYLDFALSPLAMNWRGDSTYTYLLFVRGTTYSFVFSKNRPRNINGWIKVLIVLDVRFHPLQLHRTRHVISIFWPPVRFHDCMWRSEGGEIIDVEGLWNAISIFETLFAIRASLFFHCLQIQH